MGNSREDMNKFGLWLPTVMKERVAAQAKDMGMTLTAFINMAISNELKASGQRGLGFLILEKGSKEMKEHLKMMQGGHELE